MPGNEARLEVVKQWTKRADNDLKVAEHTLKITRNCPTEIVCFHSQQCVEKYLKAYLVHINKPFPKIHDIEQLLLMFPKHISFNCHCSGSLTPLVTSLTPPLYPQNPGPEIIVRVL
jgi:HEPN domain-containing protein